MEKSVRATTETVNNHISEDLSFSILSKLPIKSLKRFGCVRKSWAILLENLHFLNMYQNYFISINHSDYDCTSIILHHNDEELQTTLYLLSGERFEYLIKLDWPNPLHDEDVWFTHILSKTNVNGIICLGNSMDNNRNYVLWNPTTNECKVIPLSPFMSQSPNMEPMVDIHAFGYDHVRDDYKLIRLLIFFERNDNDVPSEEHICVPNMWEIYSLRRNSWKKLEAKTNIGNAADENLYVDGMCHWWDLYRDYDTNIDDPMLVSFDLCDEVFLTTRLLVDTIERFDIYHLTSLNGAIAFITYDETTTFHIRILGEIGVKESWAKVFIVKPIPCFGRIIGVGENGIIFFRKDDGELVWFDLSTKMIGELGIKGREFYCRIVSYKDSILPIESL